MNQSDKIAKIKVALKKFIKSEKFFGYFYSGQFYNFCQQHSSFQFITPNEMFDCQFPISEFCDSHGLLYSRSGPRTSRNSNTPFKMNQIYETALSIPQPISPKTLARALEEGVHSTQSNIKKNFGNWKNLEYLLKNARTLGSFPILSRNHYQTIFTFMRENHIKSFSNAQSQILSHINSGQKWWSAIKKQTITGYIYLIIVKIELPYVLVIAGQTRRWFPVRLAEYSNQAEFPEKYISLTFRSLDINTDESELLLLLKQQSIRQVGQEEFWLDQDRLLPLWLNFASKKTNTQCFRKPFN